MHLQEPFACDHVHSGTHTTSREANAEKVQVSQQDGMPSIELHRETYTSDQHATLH